MSRKRGKAKKQPVAVPEEVLAEGSGPHDEPSELGGVAITVSATADDRPADDSPEIDAPSEVAEVELGTDEISLTSGDRASDQRDAAPSAAAEILTGGQVDLAVDAESDTDAESESDTSAGDDAEVVVAASGDIDLAADADAEAEDDLGAMLPTSAASMEPAQLKQLVEALVFASDKPVTVQRLRQLTRVSDTIKLEQTLVALAEDYRERGLVLQQVSGGYQFRTRSQFSPWVQQLIAGRPVRLSRAQLETLAIIAYRQPITRPEIDDIRGVDSSATLKLLIDRALIRVLGKREEVGRPMLYGTTKEFLDFFSLGDLRELPTLREYSELSEESRKVMTARLGPSGLGEGGDGGEGGGEDPSGEGGDNGGSEGEGGGSEPGGSNDGGGGSGGDHDGELNEHGAEASALSAAMEDVMVGDPMVSEREPSTDAAMPIGIELGGDHDGSGDAGEVRDDRDGIDVIRDLDAAATGVADEPAEPVPGTLADAPYLEQLLEETELESIDPMLADMSNTATTAPVADLSESPSGDPQGA